MCTKTKPLHTETARAEIHDEGPSSLVRMRRGLIILGARHHRPLKLTCQQTSHSNHPDEPLRGNIPSEAGAKPMESIWNLGN